MAIVIVAFDGYPSLRRRIVAYGVAAARCTTFLLLLLPVLPVIFAP